MSIDSEAWFTPQHDCVRRLIQLFREVRRKVDVCVFTITDDRVSSAILEAYQRGTQVRILTDNEKLHDPGSDIGKFRGAGIPVVIDETPAHMHHKFALFDGERLLTGSYNWTRGAALFNRENFLITGDAKLVAAYAAMFENLWRELGGGTS